MYKGIDRRTQKTIAIKIINLEEAEDEIEDIQQEITVLSQCDSCYITKYIGSYIKASLSPFTYLRKSVPSRVDLMVGQCNDIIIIMGFMS